MKILIYSQAFAPMVGGVETIVMSLGRRLAERSSADQGPKVEVTVATLAPRERFDDDVLPFRVVRQPGLAETIALIRAADIVHLAGPTLLPLAISLLLRKRVVVEHHGSQTACPNGQLIHNPDLSACPGHFMARRYMRCVQCNRDQGLSTSLKAVLLTFPRRWLCQLVAANIVPTHWLAGVVRLRRTTTIHHGLEVGTEPAWPSTQVSPSIIAFHGRLVRGKGVSVLLEAGSLLKARGVPFRIRIVGDGPDRATFEALAVDLGLKDEVQFYGTIPRDLAERHLSDATVIVMPSIGESFGLVAAENMLKGRLVVASDLGSLAEVVGDGGVTFPTGNASALASSLERILHSPDRAMEIRRRARARSSELFVEDAMIQQHRTVYRNLVQLRPRRNAANR